MIEAAKIWNEPNNKSHWDLQLDPGWEKFAAMAIAAGKAIRSVHPAAILFVQLGDQVDSAPDLERTGRLKVLVLDPGLGAGERGERRVAAQRGRVEVRPDLAAGGQDVLEGRLSQDRLSSTASA